MTESMPRDSSRDDLLAPGYLAGVEDRPIGQLRAMRDRVEGEEHRVSYARRILQGHIDVLEAEVAVRRGQGGAAGAHRVLDALSQVLADRGTSRTADPARVRPPQTLVPPEGIDDDLEELGEVDLSELDDDDLAQLGLRYADRERQLSDVRRELFAVLDRLQNEIADRYRTGHASVSDLLADGG